MIYLIGESQDDISSSEYLASYHGVRESSTPPFCLDKEHDLQSAVKKLIRNHLIESAHDVADGGLFITLLESAMPNGLGFDITSAAEIREDAFLFGESPSRVVVSVREIEEDKFIDLMNESNVSFSLLGHVTKGDIRVDEHSYGDVAEFKNIYDNALADKL